MSNPNPPDSPTSPETTESFADILQQYEKSHARPADGGSRQIEGTVVALTPDSVLLDIGFKSEGILPLTAFPDTQPAKVGDKVPVSVKGRDPEGYYLLSRSRVASSGGLARAGEGVRREGDHTRHRDRGSEGRRQRGCRSARLHAGLAQRHPRRG